MTDTMSAMTTFVWKLLVGEGVVLVGSVANLEGSEMDSTYQSNNHAITLGYPPEDGHVDAAKS